MVVPEHNYLDLSTFYHFIKHILSGFFFVFVFLKLSLELDDTRKQLLPGIYSYYAGNRVYVNTRSQRRMRRIYLAPYVDTTLCGSTGAAENWDKFYFKIKTFASRHLLLLLVQLHFNLTLHKSCEAKPQTLGAGNIYSKNVLIFSPEPPHPLSQLKYPAFICGSRDAVI